MCDSDEDAPPPLSSLACQVEALSSKLTKSSVDSVTTATVTGVPSAKSRPPSSYSPASATGSAVAGFKKGFFGAKPSKKKPVRQSHADKGEDEVIHIKAKPSSRMGKDVPEAFILPPDAPVKQLQEVKQKLVQALQPTPQLMQQLTGDPTLLSGFDDPEVMAAVNEVANDPSKFYKYANKPKVVKFYQCMAQFAGKQLEEKGQ